MDAESSKLEQKSMPSNILAQKIISVLASQGKQRKNELIKYLSILKDKKNFNNQTFSQYITKELDNANIDLFKIIDIIQYLSSNLKQIQNPLTQIKSIVGGFRKYFDSYFNQQKIASKIKKDFTMKLIQSYFNFDDSFSSLISQLIYINTHRLQQKHKEMCQKHIHQQIVETVHHNKLQPQVAYKCCKIIHSMNLYEYFRVQDLVHIASSVQDNSTIVQFVYCGQKRKFMEELAKSIIIKQINKNQQKAIKLIQMLKMTPTQFPELIKKLNKKSLRYFMKTEPKYSLESKIKSRPDIAQCLVQILVDNGQIKQASHYINKHYLKQFYHLNPSQNRSYNRNILDKQDDFMPTQHILARYDPSFKNKTGFLSLLQLGYHEKDIVFVNQQNINQSILNNIFQAPEFGIDCQNGPVFNKFQNSFIETVQISINYNVFDIEDNQNKKYKKMYIFDLQCLEQNQLFINWMKKMCKQYKGVIVGHTVQKDFFGLVNQVDLDTNIINCANKLKFYDIAKQFKQKYQQSKSSLQFICNYLLKKPLSKFQQCSGWHNRPLRRAQLHYAALDALLPLIIKQKL